MSKLLINKDRIKKLINLKTDNWEFSTSTNCYAFALGLDVPYSEISDHAYMVGCFAEDHLKSKDIDVCDLDFEHSFLEDLDFLEISHEEVEPDCIIKDDSLDYNSFLISLFFSHNDFHFLRKNKYDNLWYHKQGYLDLPRNRDSEGMLIRNPKDAFLYDYMYYKTYKLSYKK
jgi:hypothetical protein